MARSPLEVADSDRPLAERLMAAGRLTEEQLRWCLAVQGQRGGAAALPLARILAERGVIRGEELVQSLAGASGASAATVVSPGLASSASRSTPGAFAASVRLPPEVAALAADPARRIGSYVLLRELGRGGMGVVHRAYDAALGRPVALKMLLDPARAGEVLLRRFRIEASAAAKLRHPGIVAVYEVGEHEGKPFIAMELVEGESLEALLRREKTTQRRVAEIVREVALALAHAHERGVVHRDVKPENVIVDREGHAHLMDFGLAREIGEGERLTVTGAILGTPAYMAPEQANGSARDQGKHTDVYALGAILYRSLAGKPPFDADTFQVLITRILLAEPEPPSKLVPSLHPDLETITLRCLAKEPERRYPSAEEVAHDLRRYLDGEPIHARPIGRLERGLRWARRNGKLAFAVGALALTLVVGGVAGVLVHRDRERERERVAALELERTSALEARRAEVARILDSARRGELEAAAAFADALARLVRSEEPTKVALLSKALDEVSAELAAAVRDVYLGVKLPNEQEAAAGGTAIEGLEDALATTFASKPGQLRPREVDALVARASARLIDREARRRTVAGTPSPVAPTAFQVVAAEQERRVGRPKLALARLCCEALGRSGSPEAVAPVGRFLGTLSDEERAVPAGVALVELGGTVAAACLEAGRVRFGRAGVFERAVAAALAKKGGSASGEATTAAELNLRGSTRLDQGDVRGALADFDRAVSLEPKNALAFTNRSLARSKAGDKKGALADIDRALELDPKSAVAWSNKSAYLSSTGDREGAIASVTKAIELDARKAIYWRNRGSILASGGDFERALPDFVRAVELAPRDDEAWLELGLVRAGKGDLAAALEDLTKAIEIAPSNAGYYCERGRTRRAAGDSRGALDDYGRAIELDPRLVQAWGNRANVRAAAGDLEGAIADTSRALELSPKNVSIWLNRAGLRDDRGDFEGSIRDCDEAIELAPTNALAWRRRGLARYHAKDARAIEDLSKAVELAPKDASAWVDRSTARSAAGDLEGAIADVTRAIELGPGNATALTDRAAYLANAGRFEEALADATRAVEAGPAFAPGWSIRAHLRSRRGDDEGAIADATRALELAPRLAESLRIRGQARARKGDVEAALEDLRRYLEVAPRGREWDVLKGQVDELEARRSQR